MILKSCGIAYGIDIYGRFDIHGIDIYMSKLILGEVSTLAKNSPKFASLRTTVPMSIIRQWKLKPGDKLDWSWEVVKNEMILVVRKVGGVKSKK